MEISDCVLSENSGAVRELLNKGIATVDEVLIMSAKYGRLVLIDMMIVFGAVMYKDAAIKAKKYKQNEAVQLLVDYMSVNSPAIAIDLEFRGYKYVLDYHIK